MVSESKEGLLVFLFSSTRRKHKAELDLVSRV